MGFLYCLDCTTVQAKGGIGRNTSGGSDERGEADTQGEETERCVRDPQVSLCLNPANSGRNLQ